MKSGVARGRMSRLHPLFTGVALLIVTQSGAALAAPLLTPADATPTMNPLIVPTSAASGSTLSNATISTSSGGVELAIAMSCITTIAGLIIASITLTALIRTGYGPFLRVLLLPRWLWSKTPDKAEKPILRYKPGPSSPETGFDFYAEAPSPRRGRRGNRSARRDEWSDWDDPVPRRSRASKPKRSSSRGSSSRGGRSRY